jgi:hypothetical protein
VGEADGDGVEEGGVRAWAEVTPFLLYIRMAVAMTG